jgi:hypothetical protein
MTAATSPARVRAEAVFDLPATETSQTRLADYSAKHDAEPIRRPAPASKVIRSTLLESLAIG